jgi:hypothetical protein
VNTRLCALRWLSAESCALAARRAPFLNTSAKELLSLSPLELTLSMLSTLLRVFWRELGRSEPIAPQLPLADVRELGHSMSPARLPD